MNSLKQVIAQKNRIPNIKDLLSACEAYEFDSSNDDGPIHRMMHQLRNLDFSKKMKRKMVYTLMDIDYLQIVPHIIERNQEALEKGIKNVDVSYFRGQQQGNVRRQSSQLFDRKHLQTQGYLLQLVSTQLVAMMMRRRIDTQPHGSCAFMIPRVGKGYDLYYVNHHGEAMDGTLDYERVLTRTRNQNIPSSNQ